MAKKKNNQPKMEELKMSDFPDDESVIDIYNEQVDARKNKTKDTAKRVIIGGAELVIVLSIGWTSLYLLGVELWFTKWAIVPQLVLAGWMLFNKFVLNERK